MLYSEAFRRMGVVGVVRGSPWAAINTDGILCVMGHFDYFDRDKRGWFYEHPSQPGLSSLGSATKALSIIKSYFEPGKPVIVAVANFVTNGGPDGTGRIIAAQFREATGDAYEATLRAFDYDSGFFRADCSRRFTL